MGMESVAEKERSVCNGASYLHGQLSLILLGPLGKSRTQASQLSQQKAEEARGFIP